MKVFTIFLMTAVASLFATDTHSQATKIRIDSKSISIKELLYEIEKQSDYLFIYKPDEVNLNQQTSVNVKDKTVEAILDVVFNPTDITYAIEGSSIMLMKRPDVIQADKIRVSGTVTDKSGEPIIGASVVERGTSNGTITDMSGKFSFSVSPEAILKISYLGYSAQEVKAAHNASFSIVLDEDFQTLSEVVVVGYGTQKKVNLTGAVATVGASEFESRPLTNSAQALQGKIGNLNVYSSDGGPGKKASFNIRGYAGLGSTYTPLVIVDGVTGYFDDINPNDIESITVLKDASASAIYGAQAAYGVILVTTKSGKRNEKPVITYKNNFSWNNPTVLPKTAGSLEFAKLFRESSINEGGGGVIDLETMDRIEKYFYNPGSIPNNVPQLTHPERWSDWGDGRSNANEDWANAMFKGNQLNQSHNISVQGGNERSTYMMSLGYLNDNGKLRYYDDNYNRFNAAAKLSSDVTNWLTVNLNMRYAKEETNTPAYYMSPDGGINSLINWTWVVWPTIPVLDPNGHFSPAGRMAFIAQANPHMTYTDNIWGTASALFKILPGLTANVDFTYNKWMLKQTYSKGLIYSWSVSNEQYLDSSSPETTQIWQRASNDDFTSANAYLTYEKEYKGHAFKLLMGTQQEYKKTWDLSGDKRGLILPSMPSISTATGTQNVVDNLDHWTTRGYFGRLNYDYRSRYLFEFNLRHDGSSRYPENEKWGTFPAVSAGWNIAREKFFESCNSVFSELKIRGSYGELGNMRGKAYQYISTISYTPTSDYIMNGQRIGAFGTPSLTAFNTWETSRTLNVGIDAGSLNNRLTASFDWYKRDIIDLITKGVSLPSVLGAESPSTNNANIKNVGFEVSVGWRDHLTLHNKAFKYEIFANLSDYQGEVTKYSNPSGLLSDWYVGKKMGEIWGYETDHIMIDPNEVAEVNASGFQQQFGSNWSRGDMKYKDLDGSGKINPGKNTLDDHGDLSVIGNNTPRYNFGFGLNAEWNGFDVSAFFQGTAKRDLWLSGRLSWGLGGGQWSSNVWENTLDCWREDGSNLDPYWPRFYLGNTSKNFQVQTKYLNNGAYCRLKNAQMGYTIPAEISRKISIEKVRLYVSGENLLLFTKINKNFDPESPGDSVYPLTKSISVGLNVTF